MKTKTNVTKTAAPPLWIFALSALTAAFTIAPAQAVPPWLQISPRNPFTLSVSGEAGSPVSVQRSFNLKDWTDWQIITLGEALTELSDAVMEAAAAPREFFRVQSLSGLGPEEYFRDDFNPGQQAPVMWKSGIVLDAGYDGGTRVRTEDGWTWRPAFQNMGAYVSDYIYEDVSIHTQARLLGPNSSRVNYILLNARDGYWAGISPRGELTIWEPGKGFFEREQTNLDIIEDDSHLRFDLVGDTLSLTAWKDGEPKPSNPQIRTTDRSRSSGSVGLFFNRGNSNSSVVFRFFELKRH